MFSYLDKAIIRKLQEDLPLVPRPYEEIACELGITEEELLDKIKELKDKGVIRRFGASLNHRNVGIKGNGMVVWIVPEKELKRVSRIMVSFSEVTHCYERPTYPNWPYNVFTMIHGEDRKTCEKIVERISKVSGIKTYSILYSTEELKKSSMKYFIEEHI